jgi:hypothetical protein
MNKAYKIFDKNEKEMPMHFEGRHRTYDEAKILIERLNKVSDNAPYEIKEAI